MDDEKSFLMYYGFADSRQLAELDDHRESFNRNVLNGKATKEEILNEINQESDLLKKCEKRLKQIMMENNHWDFKSEVPVTLYNRVNDLYILLFKRFDINVITISGYINICSKNEQLNVKYKTVLDEIMHLFLNDPMIYITVANHFYDCNNIESANLYIAYAMQFYKKSKILFIQDFWMEVTHLERLGKTCFKTALIKYKHIVQHFENDINVHFDLVDKVFEEKIQCTQFQCIVIRDMVRKYSSNELMWQKLAKINLKGFIYNFDTEMLQKEEIINFINYISNFFDTYNKALQVNSSDTTHLKLWCLFLDDLIEIYNSSIYQIGRDIEEFLEVMVKVTFNQAYSNNMMRKPDHFIFLANCSDRTNELVILKEGLSISKENIKLWSMLIEYYTKYYLTEDAMCTLWESYEILKVKSLPLWKMVESYITSLTNNEIELFYLMSTRLINDDVISLNFQLNYLEWCVLTEGLNKAQEVFEALKQLEPKNLELYKKMIHYAKVGNKSLNYIRGLYSGACNTFGHMDVGIWYDCMRFEYTYGIKSKVDMIYNTGLNCLENPSSKDEIVEMKRELDEEFNT